MNPQQPVNPFPNGPKPKVPRKLTPIPPGMEEIVRHRLLRAKTEGRLDRHHRIVLNRLNRRLN